MTNSRAGNTGLVGSKITPADVEITSDATMTTDATLQIQLPVGTYNVIVALFINSHADADFKYEFETTGTMTCSMSFGSPSSTVPITTVGIATDFNTATDATVQTVQTQGRIIVTSAGLFVLKWAQLSSNAGSTKLLQGSSMVIFKST